MAQSLRIAAIPLFRRRARQRGAVRLASIDALDGNARNFQFEPRPHGRAQTHLLYVRSLDAGRLRAADGADEGTHVLDQRLLAEAHLDAAGMDYARLLGA